MKALISLLMMFAAAQAHAQAWNNSAKWIAADQNVIQFFRQHAWDEASGSYASEIDREGQKKSDLREIVPLSRMVYADSKAAIGIRDLSKARRSAEFVVRHMMVRDGNGLLFRSAVHADGRPASNDQKFTYIFEQAYGISGLTALYFADPKANADLLPVTREAAQSFWRRFHDNQFGGLFYYFNLEKGDHSNANGEIHKSYQSTIYPISSFLLALREADSQNRQTYDSWIRELLDVAMKQIVEKQAGVPTGFLRERFSADFTVDPTYKMSESGHVAQLAWVIGEAMEKGIIREPALRAQYLQTAQLLLGHYFSRNPVSAIGCVYDAFDRTTGLPLREANGTVTAAWWSNLEMIIALDFANKHNWFLNRETVNTYANAIAANYFTKFVDSSFGGEYFRINAETGEVVDSTKGNGGKSAYHITEAVLHILD